MSRFHSIKAHFFGFFDSLSECGNEKLAFDVGSRGRSQRSVAMTECFARAVAAEEL